MKLCETTVCYNGGKCVDIPGFYRCDCAAGFTGPNCRAGIDECASFPCFGGGYCKDGVNSFTCTCTKNRYGDLCESKLNFCIRNFTPDSISLPFRFTTCIESVKTVKCIGKVEMPSTKSLKFQFKGTHMSSHCLTYLVKSSNLYSFGEKISFQKGLYLFTVEKRPDNCQRHHIERLHGSSWLESCNTCTCSDGTVKCTQVVCPPLNCISRDTNRVQGCEESGFKCIERNVSCLREPCPRFGQCEGNKEVNREGDKEAIFKLKCDPASSNRVTEDCAKVHLVFSKEKLPKVNLVKFSRYNRSIEKALVVMYFHGGLT